METYRSKYTARELTKEQHEAEKLAEAYLRNEIYCCQSALVDELLKRGDIDGFSYEEVQGLYPDPDDWTVEQCREYVRERGGDAPSCEVDQEEAAEALQAEEIDYTPETIQSLYDEAIDDEVIDGIDDWRDAVRDCAEPQEVLEWWLCSEWLAKRLLQIGEPVLDNDYGYWWGRTCSGQAIMCDGTLQQVAENSERELRRMLENR